MVLGFILFSCGLFNLGFAFSEIGKSHYQNAFVFVIYFIIGVSIGSLYRSYLINLGAVFIAAPFYISFERGASDRPAPIFAQPFIIPYF